MTEAVPHELLRIHYIYYFLQIYYIYNFLQFVVAMKYITKTQEQ